DAIGWIRTGPAPRGIPTVNKATNSPAPISTSTRRVAATAADAKPTTRFRTAGEKTTWTLTAAHARSEALALCKMIGRNGETVDSIRELIVVDPDSLKALLGFLAVQPKEFRWVMEALNFRDRVLEEFDRLAKRLSFRE